MRFSTKKNFFPCFKTDPIVKHSKAEEEASREVSHMLISSEYQIFNIYVY